MNFLLIEGNGSNLRYVTKDRIYRPVQQRGIIEKVDTYLAHKKKILDNRAVDYKIEKSFSYQRYDRVEVLWEKVGLIRSRILGFAWTKDEHNKAYLMVLVRKIAPGNRRSYYVPIESLQIGVTCYESKKRSK